MTSAAGVAAGAEAVVDVVVFVVVDVFAVSAFLEQATRQKIEHTTRRDTNAFFIINSSVLVHPSQYMETNSQLM